MSQESVEHDTLAHYVDGSLDVATSVALEGAMERHPELRARVAALVPPARLDSNWRAIAADLDAPAPSLLERGLRRVGVGEAAARMAASTPALRRSWVIGTAVALLFGLGAADPARPVEGLLVLLALAPLIPVAGVALAYGPGSDPAYEMALVAPASGWRLVAVRTAAVLAFSVPATALAAAATPGRSWWAAAWLVPALALSLACLALTTWFPPRRAALGLGGAWLAAVTVVAQVAGDPLAAFGPVGQLAALVAGAVAAGVLVARREHFAVGNPGAMA